MHLHYITLHYITSTEPKEPLADIYFKYNHLITKQACLAAIIELLMFISHAIHGVTVTLGTPRCAVSTCSALIPSYNKCKHSVLIRWWIRALNKLPLTMSCGLQLQELLHLPRTIYNFKFKNTTDETTNPRGVTSQKSEDVTIFFSTTSKRNRNGT